ncbi:N-acetylneuraminate epimerase [subsurface metagenome]
MKKIITIVLVLALGLASVSLAAEGIWTTKADMPTGRWDLSTCVVDGKIYAIGGASGYAYEALRTVEEYDPATDTWTTKSEMPTARQGLSTSVVNGKIYAIGGGASVSIGNYSGTRTFSTVEEYDPGTDRWTTKSEMPTARGFHSASVVDGRIYVIGGSPSIPFSGILALEVYEPATDTWTRKGDIPRASITSSTSVVDGKIYDIGGEGSGRRVEEYDPVTDTWTQKADMPTHRTDLSTSVLDGKIYAIGGDSGSSFLIVATVEVYDPATDTWTTAPDMPTARSGPRTSVVDGKIYAIGGLTTWGAAACGTVEEYAPPLVVDFNGDGIVDCVDMCMMIDHWHTDEPLYDIGPKPLGDGIVDVQDLVVLAEHLFTYPGAVAYWKLDETEGSIAADSIADSHGIIYGDPVWEPNDGIVDSALRFDGINDYVSTPFVLNPTDGSFSVFAWVKGGAPGQVVLSQTDAANWLYTDTLEGNLMTELKGTGRGAAALLSQIIITDGDWHRIGFVWDGSHRTLYVDDVAVAEDTQDNLEGSDNGLYIGTDKGIEPGTYWSGLIDDVRIYNRALRP